MTTDESLAGCAELARRVDPDRYFCALFAPAAHREALFALLAFNGEIARIRETVREPMLGMIRLQWWRDAISAIYGGTPPRHAIATALADAIGAYDLRREPFDRLIDAREHDLDDTPMKSMAALVDYATATSSTLNGLALDILGANDGASQEAGRHVGTAWALTGLIRAVPFHAQTRRHYLPADIMAAEEVSAEEIFDGTAVSRSLCTVIARVAEVADEHLRAAHTVCREVPRQALPALLPAVLADSDLRSLRRAGFDPFDGRVAATGIGRKLNLVTKAMLGRY